MAGVRRGKRSNSFLVFCLIITKDFSSVKSAEFFIFFFLRNGASQRFGGKKKNGAIRPEQGKKTASECLSSPETGA